ncbi:MAG: hypothetical protein Kow00128_10330 [Deltaproteobacteria bacterium]
MKEPSDPFRKAVEQSIRMEFQAMNLYTTLANRAEDGEAVRVLRFLAEAEESHVGRLVELFSGIRKEAGGAMAHVDIVKAFREEGWRLYKARLAGAGLTDRSPADDYLTFAIVGEAHARSHYDRMAEESADAGMKEIFRTLAREESEHEAQLRRIQESLRRNR